MEQKPAPVSFAALLADALALPGKLHQAYRAFHCYSIGNAFALTFQILGRGLALGPVAGYQAWKAKGRQVRKGERGLWLCMPLFYTRRTPSAEDSHAMGEDGRAHAEQVLRGFTWKPAVFAFAQTDAMPDAKPHQETPAPATWNSARALEVLGLVSEPFEHVDGNVQGYARKGRVAVSPLAYNPVRTLVHEIAHNVLGHVSEAGALMVDQEKLDAVDRETEAEATAYIVLASLGLDGLEYSRGYLQSWNGGRGVCEKQAARVFRAADQILRAGAPVATTSEPNVHEATHEPALSF